MGRCTEHISETAFYTEKGCRLCEKNSEVARLQAEVERLKSEVYDANKARDLAIEWRDYDKDRVDTAHNYALEAGALMAESWSYDCAAAIRALKRPT